jgi:hypothetical protein
MILSEEIINSIVDNWNYDFCSAGIAALKELDGFAENALIGKDIIIPKDNLKINNIYDFLTWKGKQNVLSEITVLNERNLLEKAILVNTLISNKIIDTLQVTNNSRSLIFKGNGNKFTIDIFEIIKGEKLTDNEYKISQANVEFITYYDNKFSIKLKDINKEVNFHCTKLNIK